MASRAASAGRPADAMKGSGLEDPKRFLAGVLASAAFFIAAGVAYGLASPAGPEGPSAAVSLPTPKQPSPPAIVPSPASPTPIPTSTPIPAVQVYHVVNTDKLGYLNVRSAPSLSASRTGTIPEGGAVIMLRNVDAQWDEVRGADFDGFVARRYLAGPTAGSQSALTHLRVFTATPTRTPAARRSQSPRPRP